MSTKRKLSAKLAQPVIKSSATATYATNVNDSGTIVSAGSGAPGSRVNGAEVVEISSNSDSDGAEDEEDEEEEYDDDGDDDDDQDDEAGNNVAFAHVNGVNGGEDEEEEEVNQQLAKATDANDRRAGSAVDEDIHMIDDDDDENDQEPAEPSFGELVRAHGPGPIDVAAAFKGTDDDSLALAPAHNAASAAAAPPPPPPSGASLGTVLTQALRTSDAALLESCLQTSDAATIRATVQRLRSPLAAALLQQLAERLHRRPGRAGPLLAWVQWTLVAHGGYLATQPRRVGRLAALNRVLEQRARGLQSLLALRGRLDMLDAQMQLRRSGLKTEQRRDRAADAGPDDAEAVVYVEGQESSGGEEDEGGVAAARVNGVAASKGVFRGDVRDDGPDDEQSENSEDVPLDVNGFVEAALDDSDDYDDSDEDGLIDDEAEESEGETGDEDEVDHDDQDSLVEDEDDEGDYDDGEEDDVSDDGLAEGEAPPPSKIQRVRGVFSKWV